MIHGGQASASKAVKGRAQMTDLEPLLQRLKDAQHVLIDQAAASDMLPSDGELRRIAELENAIAAVAALIEERRERAGF